MQEFVRVRIWLIWPGNIRGPEAENGGEVGWIPKGVMDETLDKTLFSMAPGDVSR